MEFRAERPSELAALEGDEQFSFGATVLDFWKWSLGDLRMNTARGFLAEFFVARAVGSTAPIRVEWADYDVEARDRTRIEVKASGYLQSWVQRRPSVPSYSFKSVNADRGWDAEAGTFVPVDPAERVHTWVFALQTCRDHSRYDPLDVAQWEFRVMSHRRLLESGQKSARLSFFDRMGVRAVEFDDLAEAIGAARRDHEQLPPA